MFFRRVALWEGFGKHNIKALSEKCSGNAFLRRKIFSMGEIFQKPSDGKSVTQGKDDIPMEEERFLLPPPDRESASKSDEAEG